jgi:Cu+-exporting ATPase
MVSPQIMFKSLRAAIISAVALLAIYFTILTLVSGWEFTWQQFRDFWYFVVTLTVGFGMQVGLFIYLREITRHGEGSGKVVAVSGATSTGAMIACCTHYVANVLPVLGATGAMAFVAQYQIQLFWVALAFNLAGLLYIGRKAFQASRHMDLMGAQQ